MRTCMKNTQEILKKIEEQISSTSVNETFSQQGEILEIKDGVAIVIGLENASYSEIVLFENGEKWLVLDLLKDQVWVLILWGYDGLAQGQIVKTTGKVFSMTVGENYLGRVINGIGEPIDGEGAINAKEVYPVERVAPGVITREWVNQPMQTGIKSVDSMVPIGRGQRELIIGDRQTGKTTVAIDTILNQKEENMYCIYVAIGQKESKIARTVQILKEKGAMDYTIVVNAPANNPAVMQYMAPYVGCTLGERFLKNGKDALIIYDDLSKHAVAYREMALLLKRPPGREAYPGDVFYLHSRLLERAARVNKENGWGSLTALPIIETQANDVSAYIPTNVISITDGQIYLESNLFNSGIRPAINVWLSVSRVWGSAQTKFMKKVAGKLRLELAAYRELEAFAQFGSDLDKATKIKIERGKRMVEMLKQGINSPIPFYKQGTLIYAGINGYLDDIDVSDVAAFEKILYEKMESSHTELTDMIKNEKKLTDDIENGIKQLAEDVLNDIKAGK